VLYPESTEAGLEEALRTFDRLEPSLNPLYLRTAVAHLSEAAFVRHFNAALDRLIGRGVETSIPTAEFTTCLQLPDDMRNARPL